MISVRGIFDGKSAKPLEEVNVKPNVEVIITFLDTKHEKTEQNSKDLMRLAGTWIDNRSADEIVQDIYSSRTKSSKDINL